MVRVFSLFLLIWMSSNALAIGFTHARWTCSGTFQMSVGTEMNGTPEHFVIYGRDSWNGISTLFCQLGQNSRTRKVKVTFNGFVDGFGTDRNSNFALTLSLTTAANPDDLQVRVFVVNSEPPGPLGQIRWSFATGLTSGSALTSRVDESKVIRSLQRGTLYLRESLE
jgi:hypothetical protein